ALGWIRPSLRRGAIHGERDRSGGKAEHAEEAAEDARAHAGAGCEKDRAQHAHDPIKSRASGRRFLRAGPRRSAARACTSTCANASARAWASTIETLARRNRFDLTNLANPGSRGRVSFEPFPKPRPAGHDTARAAISRRSGILV